MSICIPLRKSLELDKSKVGNKAITLAILDNSIEIPFSMVITTDVFDEFVKYNQLMPELEWFRKANSIEDKIDSFARITTAIKNAQFPENVMDSLQECFELVSLDTNNLNNLSTKSSGSNGLISLTRSTTYDDNKNNIQQSVITKETFKQFLDTIKKVYITAFTPSAKLNSEPKVAVIVSRIPPLKATVEVNCDLSEDFIYAKSYFGFPDNYSNVEKDEFKIGLEFLKIEKKAINTQRRVMVFDSKENSIMLKEFSQDNTSQSLTDQTILEAARLVKKIAKVTQSTYVDAKFFATDDSVICVNVNCEYSNNTMDKIETKINKSVNLLNDNERLVLDKEPKEYFLEVIETKGVKELIENIKSFLENYKTQEMKSSLPIILRALENPTKDSLKQSLELCKEIISNLKE